MTTQVLSENTSKHVTVGAGWWSLLRRGPAAFGYGLVFAISVGLAIGDIRWLARNGHQLPLGGQIGLDLMFGLLLGAFGGVGMVLIVRRVLPEPGQGDAAAVPQRSARTRAMVIVVAVVAQVAIGIIINLATP